ncbi:2'-5' RNA ligase [Nitrosomonas aestuarii]|uniref:RNA 2',3'-cyclic phosphodiesterase n=1 Tax=Nitrosomonas aestuarii TaxID=52441 RepID=A0A1I4AU96_9PROT|nr:RNA 2',3'-cyclic phosphodiesterase [Nitrosomonas aestuarii]SFK59984.1 2'-5' RNA ligase [Nitrosomonas aestuarii]
MKTKLLKTDNHKPARLFFAVQPANTIQKQLGNLAKKLAIEWGGRCIKPDNIHLTLLFLGETKMDKIDLLRTAVTNITGKRFDLTIQKTGFWKRNQIIYAHADTYPPELFSLVDAIKNTLRDSGFKFDDRAYKPHITLVRKTTLYTPPETLQPIEWPVKEWLLMQSKQTDQGIRYIILDRWQLH